MSDDGCRSAWRLRALFVMLLASRSIAQPTDAEPWPRHTIDASSRGADGVRLADVNGDGLQDIATGWEEGGLIRAYINPGPAGSRERWPAVTVGRVASPEDAVFADLDGDGAVDLVSCCEGACRTVWVHWAPSDPDEYLDAKAWQTQAIPTLEGEQMWMFCLPMQVDGENGVDLVIGAKGDGAQIGWLESPADPRDLAAWRWHPLRDAGWIMSLIAADMDDDGDLDILASDRKGPGRGCFWLENPGAHRARDAKWREHRIGGENSEVMFLRRSDVDGDGVVDILAAVRGGEPLWFSPSDDGWTQDTIPLPGNIGTAKAMAVGDVDLDGRPDVVFTCENARDGRRGVMWLSRHDAATGDAHDISGPEGVKYDLVELIDLDGDGDLDALTCEESANLGVIWYENPAR